MSYFWKWFFAGLFTIYVTVYMPTPYVIYTPGSAEDVKPMVKVDKGDQVENGTFMLTTVRRAYANIALIVWKAFDPHADYGKKADSLQGRSEEEYVTDQLFNMTDSQFDAISAAYNKAKVPYKVISKGVYVIYNYPDVAKNDFKTGDRITHIDGQPIQQYEDLKRALMHKKAGETVQAKVERDGKSEHVKATLIELSSTEKPQKKWVGFGLKYGEKKEVAPIDSGKKVGFKESDIGGPSAGLMFTLEIINQLTPNDLTKGFRIAGTGTITPDGKVGAIGGVKYKVVAADREQAALFLVPEQNYAEAKAKWDTLDTNMKLVSVRTLDDALAAIASLGK
ncbi:PDZ domain-containing protein [Paenibacillus sp. 481]|nr:PDZ domain-containing protein [Paenibacillus sp. 481]